MNVALTILIGVFVCAAAFLGAYLGAAGHQPGINLDHLDQPRGDQQP